MPRKAVRNSTTSTEYVQAKPTLATSTPARAGPTVIMRPLAMPVSADAAGSRRRGRMRGVTAWRTAPRTVAATALTEVAT